MSRQYTHLHTLKLVNNSHSQAGWLNNFLNKLWCWKLDEWNLQSAKLINVKISILFAFKCRPKFNVSISTGSMKKHIREYREGNSPRRVLNLKEPGTKTIGVCSPRQLSRHRRIFGYGLNFGCHFVFVVPATVRKYLWVTRLLREKLPLVFPSLEFLQRIHWKRKCLK